MQKQLKSKQATSFRISVEMAKLIEEYHEKLGISRTAVLELAVREFVRKQKREAAA